MVLIRRCGVVALVMLAACGQSLFDANREGRGSDGPSDGALSDAPSGPCTAPCLANAGLDFDGTPNGTNKLWRYLEDLRNRQWSEMAQEGDTRVGDDPQNRIRTCAANPEAAACKVLPDALLVSAAGTDAGSDPAIELTAPSAQELRLDLRAFAPASGERQTIRLYRNSREDVLFTGVAEPGSRVEQQVTVDALPGDRFLVAVEPMTELGATDVALQLAAFTTGARFPSSCQIALGFESQTGSNYTDRLCSGTVFTLQRDNLTLAPLVLVAGPYLEAGTGATIPLGTSFGKLAAPLILDRSQGVTVQLWVLTKAFSGTSPATVFSDLSDDTGGGLSLSVVPETASTANLRAETAINNASGPEIVSLTVPFPSYQSWQFVRVVHTSSGTKLCVNGHRLGSNTTDTTPLPTTDTPKLGKDTRSTTTQALFDGVVDEVRVISGALPCEP